MASSKEYFTYVSEQLSDLNGVTFRPMMGEYIIYFRGKIIGGIYDDRLLVKPTDSAKALLPNARYELPYDGAKAMLFVDCVDDKELLEKLFSVVYEDLPLPKRKSKARTIGGE